MCRPSADSSPCCEIDILLLCVAEDTPDEHELSGSADHEAKKARSQLYSSGYRLLCTYWVVVLVGAFLLVMLAGEPSLLKCVYLVFFFLFMVTYQVIV